MGTKEEEDGRVVPANMEIVKFLKINTDNDLQIKVNKSTYPTFAKESLIPYDTAPMELVQMADSKKYTVIKKLKRPDGTIARVEMFMVEIVKRVITKGSIPAGKIEIPFMRDNTEVIEDMTKVTTVPISTGVDALDGAVVDAARKTAEENMLHINPVKRKKQR